MSVVVVGLNHRTVPLAVLEAVAVGTTELPKALHDLVGREHLSEAVVVSTCMRTEVYADVNRYHGAVSDVRTFLADWSGLPPEALSDHVYDFYDDGAVRHLLRVAAGLDSAVLGEGEILRQVRDAWDVARQEGAAGPALGIAFRQALETGKRVRTETAIARGTTSLSHTAISLAGSVGAPLTAVPPAAAGCPVVGHGVSAAVAHAQMDAAHTEAALVGAPGAGSTARTDVPSTGGETSGPPCSWAGLLADRTVLVVGAGGMGGALAALAAGGPDGGPVLVVNRTHARAVELAERIGGRALPWSELPTALALADIVLCSTAAPGIVVDADDVARARVDRPGVPLVIVDLALPRDVDATVASLPDVTLFDITDLKAHAEAAMDGRRREVPAAEGIVDADVERYLRAAAQREVAPVVAALHQRGEAVRLSETARLEGRLATLDDRQRRAVETLTRGIVAKLLHEPTVRLKAAAVEERSDVLATAIEELFGL